MKGVKTEEGKAVKVEMDRLWRPQNNLEEYYTYSNASQERPSDTASECSGSDDNVSSGDEVQEADGIQGDPQTKADYKVLRRYETTIAPITTDEYAGASSVPHMVTLKWFHRHNKWCNYDWQRDGVPSTTQGAQFDVEESANTGRVEPRHRVYLVIRALCPTQRVAVAYNAAPDPITEPSYDIMIRSKHLTPL
jgi:hypothetical protein